MSKEYIQKFMDAVYDGEGALALASFNEKETLLEATLVISDLRKENEGLREVLVEARGLLANLMFACVQADFATEIMEKHKGIGKRIEQSLATGKEPGK